MSCFGVEIRDIIIVILIILIAYLFYKTRKVEGFTEPTVNEMVRQAVNDTYLVDISSMRNLANIAQDIMSNKDDLTLPTNITIPGDLTVEGNVFYKNRNTNLMDSFPKFMVMAWAHADGIPKGWARCDGKKYKMDPNTGVVTLLNMEIVDADSIITPNLSGRFILGAGAGDGLTNREYNKTGGEENVTLTEAQMPSHSHYGIPPYSDNCYGTGDCKGGKGFVANTWQKFTEKTGGSQPHNNMPPFYVLIYIMKL